MSKDSAKPRIKIIRPRIPKFCICPFCKTKQRFKKVKEHWKTVKDINIDGPVLLKVQIVYAKCLNPQCERASFPLPIKGISKYQKATARLIKEAIASNILDNIPQEKIKGRFARSFNVTGSRPTLDRWKKIRNLRSASERSNGTTKSSDLDILESPRIYGLAMASIEATMTCITTLLKRMMRFIIGITLSLMKYLKTWDKTYKKKLEVPKVPTFILSLIQRERSPS